MWDLPGQSSVASTLIPSDLISQSHESDRRDRRGLCFVWFLPCRADGDEGYVLRLELASSSLRFRIALESFGAVLSRMKLL